MSDWIALLRRNPGFARLWLAEAISLVGDWFSLVAISVLALKDGGGAWAVALTLAAHELPMALMRPIAGVLADRFDRRNLLIGVHVAQAVLTLGMAWRALLGDVVGLQLLVLARSVVGGLDWPARSGAIRRLVREEDLMGANAIGGASWSAMYAIGMALGGLVSSFGIPLALAIDAGTFAFAAVLLMALPRIPTRATDGLLEALRRSVGDLREAARMARSDPHLFRAVAAKTPLGLAGGAAVVMLNVIADRASFAGTGAMTLGILQAMRGIGTGVGPLLAERLVASGLDFGRVWSVAALVALVGIGSLALGAPWPLLLLAAFVWGTGTGANWMLSSAEIQKRAPDAAIGRLSGLDMLSVEGAFAVSALVGGALIDRYDVPGVAAAFGLVAGAACWVAIRAATPR